MRQQTTHGKQFLTDFNELCRSHNRWSIWQDFIDMSAYTIANACEWRQDVKDKREQSYLAVAKKYNKEELELFAKLFADTTLALEENAAQDFLGDIYMDMNFGGDHGQFFTPWNVAELMADIMTDSNTMRIQLAQNGYISVNDCACGAGCMLLAFANSCKTRYNINYQQSVLFVAQDIDPVVAKMCYFQMSLLGCPGYVIVGNSLTEPPIGDVLHPTVKDPNSLWYTPLYYMRLWDFYISECRSHKDGEKADEKPNYTIPSVPKIEKTVKTYSKALTKYGNKSETIRKIRKFFGFTPKKQ